MARVSQPDDDDAAALGLLRAHERAAAANDVQEADARQSERSKLQARLRARRDGAAATGRTLEPSERLDGGCPRIFVDDVGPPTLLVQLLLGSIPPTVAAQLGGNSLALRDVLRASACFIKDVYATRWTYGHKFHQRD